MVGAINLFRFVAGCLLTLFSVAGVLITYLFSNRLPILIQRSWSKCCLQLSGIDLTVLGLENLIGTPNGFVLAANHSSMIDIVVLGSLPIDFRWISKIQVKKVPFLGWALIALKGYFVSRKKSIHDMNVMKEVEEGLKNGVNVAIFPEGTRTRTGELLPFKKGAFRVALGSGRPVVPIAICGTGSICPPGKYVPSKLYHQVTVRFGKPIVFSPTSTMEEAQSKFREQLVKLLEKGHDNS